MKRLTYILLFTLCIVQLYAEPHVTHNYACRHFTTRDGLAQMQVTSAFQDRDGYMWFGTKYGVSRYDGISFKNYTPANGMPIGNIQQIYQWGDKIVFTSTNCFVIIHPDDKLEVKYLPKNFVFAGIVNSLVPLDDDKLFFSDIFSKPSSLHSLYLYSYNDNKFIKYKGNGYAETPVYINSDTLWTYTSLYKIDHCNLTYKKIADLPLNGMFVYKINKNVYIRHNRNIYIFCREKKDWKFINKIPLNGNSNTVGYGNNIAEYDGKIIYMDNSVLKTYPANNIEFNFSNSVINSFFEDREHNLWLCTEDGIYNYFNLNIEEYRLGLANNDMIWSIAEDKNNNMWFGSFCNGLWKMSSNNKLSNIPLPYLYFKYQYFNSIKTNDHSLYFPFANGLIKYYNKKIVRSPWEAVVLSLFCDEKSKTLFRGTANKTERGLIVGFGKNEKFYGWDESFIISIAKDANQHIRVSSFNKQGIFTGDTILIDSTRRKYQGIVSMSLDSLGRLWKGTEKGIFVEMKNGKEIQLAIKREIGMITSLIIYRNKYLIAGGIKSFFVVDIQNIQDYNNPEMWEIGSDAGFTGLESGQNGMCIDHNGDVWMTTATCVLKFNPEKLVQSQHQFIPPIRVSRLFHSKDNANWEQRILPSPTSPLNPPQGDIKIASSNKFLRFEYIANSISAPRSLRFKYRLKGFSDEWSQVVYTKTAEFTNLGYGKYQFEVQCSLDGVHWSSVASSPVIHILTPFLLRWYMWVLYALLFVILIIGITLYISKRKEKKRTELLSRQKLENELQLRTLHSKVLPHFTKNVLTAIGHFAMDDNRKAGKYIAMFSKFTQLTLANSDKNYNTLEDELNYVQTYLELEQMRFGDKFSFKIETDKNVETHIYIPAMALHTYCDNAIRHGIVNKKGVGELMVTVKRKLDATLIVVSDNGIGRKRSAELGTQGNQMGLKLVQQQLDFYNKINDLKISQTIVDLEDEDGNALGTQIELLIPDGYIFSNEK